jgi:hypothetical protein
VTRDAGPAISPGDRFNLKGCRWELKEDLVKALTEGNYIKHFQYGLGVVTESDANRTTIDFDLHGIKKFVTSIMVVDPAEGTPPKRPRSKSRKKAPAAAAPAVGAKTATA